MSADASTPLGAGVLGDDAMLDAVKDRGAQIAQRVARVGDITAKRHVARCRNLVARMSLMGGILSITSH